MVLHNIEHINVDSTPQSAKGYVLKRNIWNSLEMIIACCIYAVLTIYCNIFYYINMNIYRFVDNECFKLVGFLLVCLCTYFIIKSCIRIKYFNQIVKEGVIVRCKWDKSRDELVNIFKSYSKVKMYFIYELDNERYTFIHKTRLEGYNQINKSGENIAMVNEVLVIFMKEDKKKYYVFFEECMLYSTNTVDFHYDYYSKRTFMFCTLMNIVMGLIWVATII